MTRPGDSESDECPGASPWTSLNLLARVWRLRKFRRCRYQFGLRALLVFVLVVALALGFVVPRLRRAKQHRQTVAEIQALRDHVDWEPFPVKCLEVPSWLGRLFGDPGVFCVSLDEIDDHFCDLKLEILRGAKALGLQKHLKVRSLTFDSEPVSDAELELLRDLTGLEEIHIMRRIVSMEVTDAGLEHLKGLTNLRALSLLGTRFTDAGLVHLQGLTNLEKLNLRHTNITDVGLKHLEELVNLKELTLNRDSRNLVTEEGIKKLQRALPHCRIHTYP